MTAPVKKVQKQRATLKRQESARGRSLARFARVLRAHLPEITERYKVKSLGVFGSYLRGEQKRNSDLDILIEFADDHDTWHNWSGLDDYLSELLGVKLDVVPSKNLKPFVGQRILSEVVWLQKDGVLLSQRETANARLPRRRANEGKSREPKREYLDYLHDLCESLDHVEQFTAGKSFQEFEASKVTVAATEFETETTSRSTKRIPESVKRRYANVAWKDLEEMWDKVAPNFFDVDLSRLWDCATTVVPANKPLVTEALARELELRNTALLTEQ